MPTTVPNQKVIVIHRERPEKDFLQIKNDHWMDINKKYSPYALQVYLYLAKNADNYNLALSQEAAEQEAGIRKTTFHKYISLFIEEGYLVWRQGNIYDFYETPHKQKKENVESPPCDKYSSSQDKPENSPDKLCSSAQIYKPPQTNKEIDNIYKDNKDISHNDTIPEEVNKTVQRWELEYHEIPFEEKNGIAYLPNGMKFKIIN